VRHTNITGAHQKSMCVEPKYTLKCDSFSQVEFLMRPSFLVGHITRLARLSVCLSVCPVRDSKTYRHRKTKIGVNDTPWRDYRFQIFSSERLKPGDGRTICKHCMGGHIFPVAENVIYSCPVNAFKTKLYLYVKYNGGFI